MRNKISGAIGVIWGGLILLNGLSSSASGSGAYRGGQMAAMLFGVLLVVAGVYYFFKKPKPKV
jgi:hypothetical protein